MVGEELRLPAATAWGGAGRTAEARGTLGAVGDPHPPPGGGWLAGWLAFSSCFLKSYFYSMHFACFVLLWWGFFPGV